MNLSRKNAGTLLILLGGALALLGCIGSSPTAADRPVETEIVSVPIADVKTGDLVLCADPDTGEETARTVENTFSRVVDHVRVLTVENEAGHRWLIETTDEHPLWIEPGDWVNAGDASDPVSV